MKWNNEKTWKTRSLELKPLGQQLNQLAFLFLYPILGD